MKPGDHVEVETMQEKVRGILITTNPLVIKLHNGYNIGIDSAKIKKIKTGKKPGSIPTKKLKPNKRLPNITFIATGGTIGTHVDYVTGGVFMITLR